MTGVDIAGFDAVSDAVFETVQDPVVVSSSQIAALVQAARAASQGRARLILHDGRDDLLHEMVIALPPESCDHPHINAKSGKSFLALSGQFAVVRGSDDGSRIVATVLSGGAWPGARLARLRKAAWHTIIPLAGDTVFLETIIGPFTGNAFAAWFPSDRRSAEHAEWVGRLRAVAHAAARVLVEGSSPC